MTNSSYASIAGDYANYQSQWDPHSRTYWIDYKDAKNGNRSHQIWFDSDYSFQLKYETALAMDIRGVGVWTLNYLNYSDATQVKQMWDTFPNYKQWARDEEYGIKFDQRSQRDDSISDE